MKRLVAEPSKSIEQGCENHCFEILDNKGRELGAQIIFSVHTYVEHPQGFYKGEPGEYLCFRPQQTRGGVSYGACQKLSIFKTEEQRIEGVKKYLQGAKKRALKQRRD